MFLAGVPRFTPKIPDRSKVESRIRLCALAAVLAIGAGLAACEPPSCRGGPAAPAAPTADGLRPAASATAAGTSGSAQLLSAPGHARGKVPARVALLLPFSSPQADTRAVAQALEKAAELAVLDSKNADILLMPRDEWRDAGKGRRRRDAGHQ